jgi:hypothetical protein
MSIECIIPQCTSKNTQKALFGFPKDAILLEKWKQSIPILALDSIDLNASFICQDHFLPSQIKRGSKQLIPQAVPTEFSCCETINLDSCRICLGTFDPLLGEKVGLDAITEPYQKLMGSELLIDVNLPNFACKKCHSKLEKLAREKSQIRKIQEHLASISNRKLIKHIKEEETEVVDVGIDDNFYGSLGIDVGKIPAEQIKQEEPRPSKELTKRRADKRIDRYKEKIPCQLCGLKISRWSMNRHIVNVHKTKAKPKNLECDFCGYRSSKRFCMDQHMQNKHVKCNDDLLRCNLCDGKTFASELSLRSHMRIQHEGNRTFPDVCI